MLESNNAEIEPSPALEQREAALGRALATLVQQQAAQAAHAQRRGDGHAAVIATLVGLLAVAISGYTAYVQRQQLRAQVWPCISVSTPTVPPMVGVKLTNAGTGPARILAARVTVDNHPVEVWARARKAMGGDDRGGAIFGPLTGSVLSPGAQSMPFRPYDENNQEPFRQMLLGKHLVVTLCYCSVLDECWVIDTEATQSQAIGDPENCPIKPAERFKR